jgi:hypothetical protein
MSKIDLWHDSPLAEMFEKNKRLFALCSKHGLKREAYSIIFGEEMPEPEPRGPGRPRKKDDDYMLALKVGMAGSFLRKPERYGDRTRFARACARQELESQKGSRVTNKEIDARAHQIQNDMAKIPREELAIATYVVRRMELGESLDEIMKLLQAVMSGDEAVEGELQRKARETVPDILRRQTLHKNSET